MLSDHLDNHLAACRYNKQAKLLTCQHERFVSYRSTGADLYGLTMSHAVSVARLIKRDFDYVSPLQVSRLDLGTDVGSLMSLTQSCSLLTSNSKCSQTPLLDILWIIANSINTVLQRQRAITTTTRLEGIQLCTCPA
jgi:hypothetical protein